MHFESGFASTVEEEPSFTEEKPSSNIVEAIWNVVSYIFQALLAFFFPSSKSVCHKTPLEKPHTEILYLSETNSYAADQKLPFLFRVNLISP